MSKLVSEADKLLEKGKVREALEKLKMAQKAEPMNQLVATKLAGAYVQNGEPGQAVKVLVALADRFSDAGKSQVAIAIYKQALELDPSDIDLKVKFAIECEAAGKLTDAQTQAQLALKHYLRRKKYFDAANLMPLMIRLQGKDDKLKESWIEILQLSGADQKLIHLLVALCGPPGLVSQEFSVGGEPAALSPALYEGLKRLVPFFPRDPKVAYSAAWAAQRRGNTKDLYFYLRECLRREPDFCLALLLFARILAEQQKLNEALFVYKHLKDRVVADKSVDLVTLNRLVEDFAEKNGWISFSDGDAMDAASFRGAILGVASSPPVAAATAAPPLPAAASDLSPPPAAPAPPEPPATSPEVSASTLPSASLPGVSEVDGLLEKGSPTSILVETERNESADQAEVDLGGNAGQEMEVEFTNETRMIRSPAPAEAAGPSAAEVAPPLVQTPATPPAEKNSSPKITFNPFESSAPKIIGSPASPPDLMDGEKTEMFSPLDLLDASDRRQSPDVKTKVVLETPEALAEIGSPRGDLPVYAPTEAAPAPISTVDAPVEGPATQLYSPLEAVEAGAASRRAHGAGNAQKNLLPEAEAGNFSEPPAAPSAENFPESRVTPADPVATEGAGKIGGAFMPIPDFAASAAPAAPAKEDDGVDLGDDLLSEPTRVLVLGQTTEPTSNLVKELKKDLGRTGAAVDANLLMRKSERYIAKRNYYMARKILRHALAAGGDEQRIKERLRDIRKLEMPDGLYNAISSDEGAKEGSEEILSRLEREFELRPEGDQDGELAANVDTQLENIFRETDPRTILDFGVALHEMGLYRQAETVFTRLVEEFPDISFDAYYLAAVSKFARKDYAGAASILKKLSADGEKTDLEKIQVYYALGELFEKMQRPESSREFYQKVAGLDANYRNVRHKLEK